nr:hypothetical protein [Paenibacillus ginsengihumi]
MNAAMLQDERGGQFGADDSIFGRGEEPKRPYDVLRLPAFHLRTMGQPVDIADIAAFLASDGKALDYRAADRREQRLSLGAVAPAFLHNIYRKLKQFAIMDARIPFGMKYDPKGGCECLHSGDGETAG